MKLAFFKNKLGWLCVLSVALLYARLYFPGFPRLYSYTPVYRWQAIAFLRGHLYLPADFSCAGEEMILFKGRLYYYFAPLPSLIHAGYILLTQKLFGQPRYLPESVTMFLFVCAFPGVIFAAFSAKARALGRGPWAGALGCIVSLAVCAFSIFFDLARYRLTIFEEAVLYSAVLGSASVLAAYVYALRWYQDQPCERLPAIASSVLCAAAMLCRPNYLAFPVFLAPWMIIPHLRPANPLYRFLRGPIEKPPAPGWGEGNAVSHAAIFLALPLVALVSLLLYNYTRFDDPLALGSRYIMELKPELIAPSRAPLVGLWLDPIKAFFTGFDSRLFFPHRGILPDRTIEESLTMHPPFAFERVRWVFLPLVAALGWHLARLVKFRNRPSHPLARLDCGFLLLGVVIIFLHIQITGGLRLIAYRYVFDMLPAFLAMALAGLGFRGSYLTVTCLWAVAFLADAPHYLQVWANHPNRYVELHAPFPDAPTLEQPARANCPYTAIPTGISCGAPEARQLHPKAHLGWDLLDGCGAANSIYLVFSVGPPGPHDRWRLDLLADQRFAKAAQNPRMFIQGRLIPLQPRRDGQPGFFADFTLKIDAATAKALPVRLSIHPGLPFEYNLGKLLQVRLAGLPAAE